MKRILTLIAAMMLTFGAATATVSTASALTAVPARHTEIVFESKSEEVSVEVKEEGTKTSQKIFQYAFTGAFVVLLVFVFVQKAKSKSASDPEKQRQKTVKKLLKEKEKRIAKGEDPSEVEKDIEARMPAVIKPPIDEFKD